MSHGHALVTAIAIVCTAVLAIDARADPTIRPDITVSGSTTGDAKFAAAVAWWFATKQASAGRPKWRTLALDLSGTFNNGESKFFRDRETGGFSSQGTALLGISGGFIHGNSEADLEGQPAADALLDLAQLPTGPSARLCSAVCYENPKAAGCDRFKEYSDIIVSIAKGDWFNDKVLDLNSHSPDPIRADSTKIADRMRRLVPSKGVKCNKATEGWSQAAKRYVDAEPGKPKAEPLKELREKFESGLKACAEECEPLSSDDCLTVKVTKESYDALSRPDHDKFRADIQKDLCEVGGEDLRQKYKKLPVYARLEGARYPRIQAAFGASFGFTPQEFLEVAEVDAAAVLTPREYTYLNWKAGASGASVFLDPKGFTVEWRGLYARSVEEQETKAEYCVDAGVVNLDSTTATAESCTSSPLGRPTTSHDVDLDLRFGYAHLKSGAIRVAGGPNYLLSVPKGDPGTTHTFGAQLPLYINFLAVPRMREKLDYDGLIRIAPFGNVTLKRTDMGKWPYSVGVSFALLGRRSMFSTKYDEL